MSDNEVSEMLPGWEEGKLPVFYVGEQPLLTTLDGQTGEVYAHYTATSAGIVKPEIKWVPRDSDTARQYCRVVT